MRTDYHKMTEQELRSNLATVRDRLNRPGRLAQSYVADRNAERAIMAVMSANGFHTYTGHGER